MTQRPFITADCRYLNYGSLENTTRDECRIIYNITFQGSEKGQDVLVYGVLKPSSVRVKKAQSTVHLPSYAPSMFKRPREYESQLLAAKEIKVDPTVKF